MSKINYKKLPIDLVIASLATLAVIGVAGLTIHIVKSIILW